MKLKRTLSLLLMCLTLIISPIITMPVKAAANETVTIQTVGVGSAKKVCGYAKDANGNPLKNKTLYIGRYDSFIHSSEEHKLIKDIYADVKTDSNGYYSINAEYYSGYYYVFLPSRYISDSEFDDIYFNGKQWPSRFIIQGSSMYSCDTYDSVYVLN
ncbi:hypothetical protein [Clostridium sp. ZS1]|uniref:hypothetical protein n=1 Tax=Clostridium sp. ZS1 TaxID=2949989 RepID=UPI002079E657|nr:hypothetical protein [Clostridium sp. ZS1]